MVVCVGICDVGRLVINRRRFIFLNVVGFFRVRRVDVEVVSVSCV